MTWARLIAGIPKRQLAVARNALVGRPIKTPPFVAGTTDPDDIRIAESWLARPSEWNDVDVIREYETSFAEWNGSKHASSFMSGRVALSACIDAFGLAPGDEIVIPGYTCIVVANACRFANVEPVFADIELDTYGLDIASVESRLSERTRAILIQHTYGLVSRDYEALVRLARRHKLSIIEDCCHATGASLNGTKVGNLGDVALYSSEHSKVFSTVQGGLATTNDDELATAIRDYQQRADFPDEVWVRHLLETVAIEYYQCKHPQRWWRGDAAILSVGHGPIQSTSVEETAGNMPSNYGRRMPAPVAALGINQLQKIDGYNQMRREIATRWDAWCDANQCRRPHVIDGSVPVYLRYPVLVDPARKRGRDWALTELGVRLGGWFETNLHPAHGRVSECPNADDAVERCVNFPCLPV